VHVIAVEYPGYGIYDGQPEAYQIQKDAEAVYDYLTLAQGIPESQIILFGRSIGTGPATYLASRKSPCALLLMSPFTSIRDIVKESAGNLLSYLI
jgi:pimeloyl-ACP methyl ester carboxylesterase